MSTHIRSCISSVLWGIVNNAGMCYIGNIETMTHTDIEKIFAVNFLGPVYVCKAFLPLLRRGKGRLVNIASNSGGLNTVASEMIAGT